MPADSRARERARCPLAWEQGASRAVVLLVASEKGTISKRAALVSGLAQEQASRVLWQPPNRRWRVRLQKSPLVPGSKSRKCAPGAASQAAQARQTLRAPQIKRVL